MKYTCVKSGKKLVWNKGVSVKAATKPDLNPVLKPVAPTPAPVATPTPSPTPQVTAGTSCLKLGVQLPLENGLLECRFLKDRKLTWVSINKKPESFVNPSSAENVSVCKLQGEIDGNHITGFGVDISTRGKYGNSEKRPMPAVGVNDSIIIPVDFVDFPGDTNLKEILAEQTQNLESWVKYFSSGKLQFNVTTHNSWIRMPEKARFYNQTDYDLSAATGGQDRITAIAQIYIDVFTKEIDLTKYKTVYILYPSEQNVITTDLVPRMVRFNVKEGTTTLSVFARSTYDQGMKTPFWAFYLHETGHDWGLYGHAPANGWPIGLMVNQSAYSLALFAWERFLLSWLPDDMVYCDTKAGLKTAEVKLSAQERDDFQTKMIGIKLDESRLLVIESHGSGIWTSRRSTQNYNFDTTGFYGVIAYVVDTKFTVDRPFVKPDGSVLNNDDGVTRAIPRYAYMYPIDSEIASNRYGLRNNSGPMTGQDYDRYIAVQGDTITIEGVKITVVSTGDYETVRIEKAG
jgi:M6 family metalloprotease-like protein